MFQIGMAVAVMIEVIQMAPHTTDYPPPPPPPKDGPAVTEPVIIPPAPGAWYLGDPDELLGDPEEHL